MKVNVFDLFVKHAISLYQELAEAKQAQPEPQVEPTPFDLGGKEPYQETPEEAEIRKEVFRDKFICQKACEFAKTMTNEEAFAKAEDLAQELDKRMFFESEMRYYL